MLTFEKQLDTFASTLRFQRRGLANEPKYTDQELIRLADDFLKSVSWVNLPTAEQLAKGMRSRWIAKSQATRARKQALAERVRHTPAQGSLF